ncbi:hypothetical protein Hdeb2414_s0015g00445191 [Helianthus debilis subsp. tardiflorus]
MFRICLFCNLHAGALGALGKFEAEGAPKKHAEKAPRGRGKKKPEAPTVPPLVPQVAGISRSHSRRYTDYVVVSNTLDGLGVPGGGAVAGGTSAGSKPADEKKRRQIRLLMLVRRRNRKFRPDGRLF